MKARQYVSWLDEQFFKDGCGSALLLLPVWEAGKVIYRNEYRGFVPYFGPWASYWADVSGRIDHRKR